MKPLHLIDCSLVVYMHRAGPISSRQFQKAVLRESTLPQTRRAIARDLGTSITGVQKSLDSLVAAKLVRVMAASPIRGAKS